MRAPTVGDRAERAIALVRLAGLPAIALAEALVDVPGADDDLYPAVIAVAAAWALGAAALAFAPRGPRPPLWLQALVDVLLIGLLVGTTGGAASELRPAFFIVPLGAALLAGPRATAAASAGTLAAAVAVDLLAPAPGPQAERVETVQAVFLAWTGLTCTLLSALLARRGSQVRDLAADRGRLVAGTLEAEDRERARLAEALHDETIQSLLAVRQEAGRAAPDLAFVRDGLGRAVAQLRDEVFDLQPHLLRQAGLGAALQAVADRHADRDGGAAWHVAVDPAAGQERDELLFHVGRELMANAARHARASRVDVTVARERDAVVLEVADDGVGLDPARAREAPSRGHIGLASSAERAEALGGRLEIASGPGAGTRVTVTVPPVGERPV